MSSFINRWWDERLCRKLVLSSVDAYPHDLFVEPFAGKDSIFLQKNKAQYNWLNGPPGLVSAYIQIRDRPLEVLEVLMGDCFKCDTESVHQAARLVSSHYCARSPNDSREEWLSQYSKKLNNVLLTSLPFNQMIGLIEDDSLVFINLNPFNQRQRDYLRTALEAQGNRFAFTACALRPEVEIEPLQRTQETGLFIGNRLTQSVHYYTNVEEA